MVIIVFLPNRLSRDWNNGTFEAMQTWNVYAFGGNNVYKDDYLLHWVP